MVEEEGGGGWRVGEGGGGGGECWQDSAMFSEAWSSGSITGCDGEKCLPLMKDSSVSHSLSLTLPLSLSLGLDYNARKALCN